MTGVFKDLTCYVLEKQAALTGLVSIQVFIALHSVTTYKGQREFETRESQTFPINLTSHVPKLSQILFKLPDVSNLIPNGCGKK